MGLRIRSACAIVLLGWTAGLHAAAAPVAARMRNVVLHMGYGVELHIDDLRGHFESPDPAGPSFDDINSYVVALDYARVAMTPASLTNLMNQYVFAGDDAPLKKIAISIEGDELVQSGELKKGISVPFKMHASVSLAPDGRLRLHPTSMKAAGFVSKRVLDFFGLELEKLVKMKGDHGVTVEGDDLLLEPGRMLPPPHMRGRATKTWIENGRLMLQFGNPAAKGIEPPKPVTNYMYYRGGTLRFGKLTMRDTDLLLVDADPRDPFDFSPAKYEDQLVAGTSKNTRAHGLIVTMPDANDAAKGESRTSR
jgi:hypothetical protein